MGNKESNISVASNELDISHANVRNCIKIILLICYLFSLLIVIGYLTGGIKALYESTTIPLTFSNKLALITQPLNQITYVLVIIYGVFLHRIVLKQEKHNALRVRSVWLCSLVLACALVCGSCAAQIHSIYPFYGSPLWIVTTCFSIVIMTIFAYSLILPLFSFLRSITATLNHNILRNFRGRHFAIIFAILVIGWLPYIVVFSPGSPAGWDFSWQLSQFFGYTGYSSHHPLASTIVYGIIGKIGYLMGGDNGTVMAVVVFQTTCFALAFSFELVVMRNAFRAPTSVIVCSLAFYILLPIFGSFCQWNIKDSLFAAVFTCYITLIVLLAVKPSIFSNNRLILFALFASAMGVGLLRNNGAIIVFFSLPFLFLLTRKKARIKILILSLVVCLCIPLTNSVLTSCLNAQQGSVREALSIPFQQTARYAQTYPEDIEAWERDAIDQVLPYKEVTQNYKWNHSDAVKNQYKENSAALPGYFKAWLSQGIKHPEVYIEATVLNSYGFWYVENTPSYDPFYFALYSQDSPESIVRVGQTETFEWSYFLNDTTRNRMVHFIEALRELPFISIFCQPGIYCWLVILGCSYLAYRGNRRYLVIYLAPVFVILTCIAGPVNGYLRYALGLIACTPILIWATLFLAAQKNTHRA